MYYQIEQLAYSKQQEMEKVSREAWKFASIKKESIFQKAAKSMTFGNKKSQSEYSSCVAC
jgi:TfoX/Sxy family transcriptional regulator of competence genes